MKIFHFSGPCHLLALHERYYKIEGAEGIKYSIPFILYYVPDNFSFLITASIKRHKELVEKLNEQWHHFI